MGEPVFNFRSDGRFFAHSTRCLIPTDGFYEFTDPMVQGKKTKWLLSMAGQPWFWIAGIVKDRAFAMVATSPRPGAPYHERQIVVLPAGAGAHWLNLSTAEDFPSTQSVRCAGSRPGVARVKVRDFTKDCSLGERRRLAGRLQASFSQSGRPNLVVLRTRRALRGQRFVIL